MDPQALRTLLEGVKSGHVSIENATEQLAALPYLDLGFAKLDTHRSLRKPEVETVFCQGKRPDQVAKIVEELAARYPTVLATRADRIAYEAVLSKVPIAEYHPTANVISVGLRQPTGEPRVAICTAGTADEPVAEEAALTLTAYGNPVRRIYDVGVAGLQRILGAVPVLRTMRAIIVVAGMDGALPSVVAGLVSCPVIAVPTSIGYGAAFGGLAPLLAMLNSCATGVCVVNIDNGFGAGYLAHLMVQQA